MSGGIILTGEKSKDSERNLSQCHFAHQKPALCGLGANPGLRGEEEAADCLNCGTTVVMIARASRSDLLVAVRLQ
jgi:hypothetical protein